MSSCRRGPWSRGRSRRNRDVTRPLPRQGSLVLACVLAAFTVTSPPGGARADQRELSTPGFHHLHLNSTDPEAAIAFYVEHFPTTRRSSALGLPALKTGQVSILFTRVGKVPPATPQSA